MAHEYVATVRWRLAEAPEDFAKGRYSRGHEWAFDCGIMLAASASPAVVPLPYSREDAVDPEEAYVASLASCHMLTFVDLARRDGLVVESYEDKALGIMERLSAGKFWISRVTLRPKIIFAGDPPVAAALDQLHHRAHEFCFIANSVKTEIVVEPA